MPNIEELESSLSHNQNTIHRGHLDNLRVLKYFQSNNTMSEALNEIADAKISTHDKHRFEVKLDIEMASTRKSTYLVETYFFIPKALNINPNTYSKEKFYSSIQRYIRFKTPQISIPKLVDPCVGMSPFNRLKKTIPLLLSGDRTIKTTETAYKEIKLLGAIFRGSMRDHVRSLLKAVTPLTLNTESTAKRKKQFEDTGLAFLSDIRTFAQNFSTLREEMQNPAVPTKLREAALFLDEFIILTIEELLTTLLDGLRRIPDYRQSLNDLDRSITAMIEEQQVHRQTMGYPSLIMAETKNANLPYRRSILKKFISSILYLNVEIKEWEGWAQFSFGVAAGIAMLFAAIVTVFAQSRFATNSWPFVTVLVISYIFKDRLKDWLKLFFSKSMIRWISDRKTKIKDPYSSRTIGYLKEAFSFIEPSRVPAEILYRRNADNITSIDEDGKPEHIMKYEKEIVLFPQQVTRFHARLRDLNDIMRMNVEGFLTQADDPIVQHQHWDSLANCLKNIECSRTYHINMVIRYTAKNHDHNAKTKFERVRLIVNQDGIVDLQDVFCR